MKRCPECLFIYPDSDARCDFDHTPLVVVDEAELAEATTPNAAARPRRATKQEAAASVKRKPATKKRKRKVTAVSAIVGLLAGIASFVVYYRSTHHDSTAGQTQITANVQTPAQAPATNASAQQIAASIPTPPVVETAPSSPTPIPSTKSTTERTVTAHTSTTFAPVSTSGPGMGKKPGAKPTILLTTGSKIEADEIWRTRDGVWYRRDGIVTLLKRGRVKAIVNQ